MQLQYSQSHFLLCVRFHNFSYHRKREDRIQKTHTRAHVKKSQRGRMETKAGAASFVAVSPITKRREQGVLALVSAWNMSDIFGVKPDFLNKSVYESALKKNKLLVTVMTWSICVSAVFEIIQGAIVFSVFSYSTSSPLSQESDNNNYPKKLTIMDLIILHSLSFSLLLLLIIPIKLKIFTFVKYIGKKSIGTLFLSRVLLSIFYFQLLSTTLLWKLIAFAPILIGQCIHCVGKFEINDPVSQSAFRNIFLFCQSSTTSEKQNQTNQ